MTHRTLHQIALYQLAAMYKAERGLFAFRRRRHDGRMVAEGESRRYTAIALIGLASEEAATARDILGGHSPASLCAELAATADADANPGDLALLCWATVATGCDKAGSAWQRLAAALDAAADCPIVELSWALSALSLSRDASLSGLRDATALRLMQLHNPRWGGFPHTVSQSGPRGHVSCFADLVYPILALTQFVEVTGDPQARAIATATAAHACDAQGPSGQWWWHYDARVGTVIEPFPVYSVHQHAMAPMALHSLERVSATRYTSAVARGLDWLASAPELSGGSLVDSGGGVIWRKVARREPAKTSRYIQAIASRLRPGARMPGVGSLFPPGAIDFECRPYEFGWFLYAWPEPLRAAWPVAPAEQVTA